MNNLYIIEDGFKPYKLTNLGENHFQAAMRGKYKGWNKNNRYIKIHQLSKNSFSYRVRLSACWHLFATGKASTFKGALSAAIVDFHGYQK